MSGLSLEALNDIGQRQTQMLIVVNDNEMSISPTVGAFSHVPLPDQAVADAGGRARAPTTGPSSGSRSSARRVLELQPAAAQVGRQLRPARPAVRGPRDHLHRGRARPRHPRAARDAGRALALPGPTIVHVRTQKGRGFRPAETDQVGFHGAALPPIAMAPAADAYDGTKAGGDADRIDGRRRRAAGRVAATRREAPELHGGLRGRADRAGPDRPTDRGHHGRDADRDRDVQVPGRVPGSDVRRRDRRAALGGDGDGLAMGGMRPVVALYSTFLQRAFDQTVHDVCQNDQPVLIAVDRAGLVGEDGTSHQGMFTLPAQRQLPNLVIASPKDEQELRSLLHTALSPGPPVRPPLPARRRVRAGAGRAVGHPGRAGRGAARGPRSAVRRLRADRRCGRSRPPRRWRTKAGRSASSTPGIAKPLDRQLILDQARGKRLVVTFEESVVTGGFGSGVLELVEEARLADPA